jgi:hypothetical protein
MSQPPPLNWASPLSFSPSLIMCLPLCLAHLHYSFPTEPKA